MRRAVKHKESIIIKEGLRYSTKNINSKISQILLSEQKCFCAYTDEYINRTDAADIEHFNPKLKLTDNDSYNNWFLVKHQWNKEKSYKWDKFQPALHPTATDFEARIIYNDGDYFSGYETDIEAMNTVSLLKLDDPGLAEKRKKYITRKKKEIEVSGLSPYNFFNNLLTDDICQISYVRAIKEEFDINILDLM